jgi:2-polyprenyl-3-methyl-5-hydroxy-6-metoxy-1,4-benzoquinol methylase
MREKQYEILNEINMQHGRSQLGLMSNQVWFEDPKRFTFYLSRYKFVSRILQGFSQVLEVGCGDAFASRVVSRAVGNLTVSDFDSEFLQDIRDRNSNDEFTDVITFDPTLESKPQQFDAIYALDVIEHIPKIQELVFLRNIHASLKEKGVAIFGTPSLESQIYASEQSKQGHVNCKSAKEWKSTLKAVFPVVIQFGMNDEVVHTGFDEMCHYLFFICIK